MVLPAIIPPGPFRAEEFIGQLEHTLSPFADLPWQITLEFGQTSSSALESILAQARRSSAVEELISESGKTIYCVTFSVEQVPAFEEVYKKVKGWKTTQVKVNGEPIPLRDINGWLRCYRDKLHFLHSNPLFCWGASPFTFNVFGCHRTMIRDAHPEWTDNWYEFVSIHPDGTCIIDKSVLAAKIVENVLPYRFCPALRLELLALGFSIIPESINPNVDPDWEYVYLSDRHTPIGVKPKLTELVLDMKTGALSTSRGQINVTREIYVPILVTPHFAKLYAALQSHFGIKGPDMQFLRKPEEAGVSGISEPPEPNTGSEGAKTSDTATGCCAVGCICLVALIIFIWLISTLSRG